MEEEENSQYVAQLKAEFDTCDTTATGYLDRGELQELCKKLQLEAHLPLLLQTLLGEQTYGRVNFEEFKDGFVAVLSRSLDYSTSEDDSSYLEPVVPEEVKPVLVKGSKRYGRRSRPDSNSHAQTADSQGSTQSRAEATGSPTGLRRAKLRRATSLESVESLKSDEETGNQKDIQPDFQNKAPQQTELGVVVGEVLTAVCDHLGLQQLNTEDVEELLRKLDSDLDGRVSVRDFCSGPLSCSTPQRGTHRTSAVLEERSLRCPSPSLLTAAAGQRILSRLDDGSGCSSAEKVISLWTEEGIRNSQHILQTLDFPLDERLSLTDLTLALDNELLVSGNGIHQAALISYKNEIQHLQVVAEQSLRQRDKLRSDLEAADQRNLQLVREVDDRHANMETLNHSKIRDLEQEFRERLSALRVQSEQESESLLTQLERERSVCQRDMGILRATETALQEELYSTTQENIRLDEELTTVKLKLNEAENSVNKLQRDLDQLLQDKFGGLEAANAGLSHEERFSEIVKDYELQCRELRDRNDELSSELELFKGTRSDRKTRRSNGDTSLTWSQPAESDSDESDMKRSSPLVRKKLQPPDKTALGSLDSVSSFSIQTELALEQLKLKHNDEIQQLNAKLETQVNYYERSLEVMRQSIEVERKDISQAFKLEISELEEQKSAAELQLKQLKHNLEKLQNQIQNGGGGGGGGWGSEQERRMQRERADTEQNFAREISNLVQRLSAEKDQLEAELRLQGDQEVMRVRNQLEECRSENGALQQRLSLLQQQLTCLEDDVAKNRRRVEESEREREKSREEEERLHKENSRFREEVLDLSSRNLSLSNDNADLSARLRGDEEAVLMLRDRLATVTKAQEDERETVLRLQDAATQQQRGKLEEETTWNQERKLMETQLSSHTEKLGRLEAELSAVTLKLDWLKSDKEKLLREAEERNNKIESLQQTVLSLEADAHRLLSANQERESHNQEVTETHRKLQIAHNKVGELESSVENLLREKEELTRVLEERENLHAEVLQQETDRLRGQNQQLTDKALKVVRLADFQRLTQDQQSLRSKVRELETERTQAKDQALRADTALGLVQAQHVRKLQELQTAEGAKQEVETLQLRLIEEQKKSRALEETIRVQSLHRDTQVITKQDQYDKALSSLQSRMEELEIKLKAVRLVLQEKVQKLKEMMYKNSKCSSLLKDLYVENSELLKALTVTEQRQKQAEKKNFLLEDKVNALNQLLREIVPAALAT